MSELFSIIVKPRFHVFGHIHPSHGIAQVWGTTFINATVCDDPGNRLRWPATVIDL